MADFEESKLQHYKNGFGNRHKLAIAQVGSRVKHGKDDDWKHWYIVGIKPDGEVLVEREFPGLYKRELPGLKDCDLYCQLNYTEDSEMMMFGWECEEILRRVHAWCNHPNTPISETLFQYFFEEALCVEEEFESNKGIDSRDGLLFFYKKLNLLADLVLTKWYKERDQFPLAEDPSLYEQVTD